jgi:heme/copper-type cytochrome/quinol oxidase subunit 3
MYRLSHDAWAGQAANTNTEIGLFNTFVLLTSSLFAVLAHRAAEAGDGKKAARLLYYTIGGAVTFVCVKAFEWNMEISHGYTITANTFWSFYYTAAGIHALHVIAGAIIMAIVAKDAAKNAELHRVELIGIYWHFVDIVWIFLFPLLYIAK